MLSKLFKNFPKSIPLIQYVELDEVVVEHNNLEHFVIDIKPPFEYLRNNNNSQNIYVNRYYKKILEK
jgi:hypothetical protein